MIAKKKNGWVWREWLYLIAIVALFAWAMNLREALAKDFIPQWAERLFSEDYEIKLWF